MPLLRRPDGEFQVPDRVPVVALRDLVFFPYMVLPLLVGRPRSVAALEAAEEKDGYLLLVAQRTGETEEPGPEDVHAVGTVVRVVESSRIPDGTFRVVFEGVGRARLEDLEEEGEAFFAAPTFLDDTAEPPPGTPASEAAGRAVERLFAEYARLHERVPDELGSVVPSTDDRFRRSYLVAGHLLLPADEKQELLEAADLPALLDLLRDRLARELEILRIEEKLDREIETRMDSGRRELYLQEQLKAIQKELGGGDGEWAELERGVEAADLPAHARERAEKELRRLQKLNPLAPEAAVIRTYLDWILALPWTRRTEDRPEVERASAILEEAHHGLSEVKERILDHIAVLSLVGELQGPILCLVGPPGVGKTSLGRSIATALDREFVRVSLGGVRDEAEIRGHRRTYVGALPGRVLQGMRRSGSRNPVFLLDEVDKLAADFHGDPGAALLEVLDPEQNRTFTDHYLELEFDLSDVLFVATANTLGGIPGPLRDRMEVIRIPGYLDTEKRTIATRFLWPRQAERHGLDPAAVSLDPGTVENVIRLYTRVAGVRELERRIGRIARKVAREVALAAGTSAAADVGGAPAAVDGDDTPAAAPAAPAPRRIDSDDLRGYLGPPPYLPGERDEEERSGIANGLAWTEAGGEVLDVEVAVVPGSGKIRLTGTLGDVMKESAFAAVTYARSRAPGLGLSRRFHQDADIHVHIPEGATPKDGPSAGITVAVALISALTDVPTRPDVAMTGEITLRGRVLPVGGIKEKAVAALRSGVRLVLVPAANEPDLELLPDEVREGLEFRPVRTMDEVLEAALVRVPGPLAGATAPFLNEIREPGASLSQ